MYKIFQAIVKTIKNGPGIIEHTKGGLIRYYIEDTVADIIDADIQKRFNINLRDPSEPITTELCFLIYFRNMFFYFERTVFTSWNIFCSHYKHDGKKTEIYYPPKALMRISYFIIFCYLLSVTFYKLLINIFQTTLHFTIRESDLSIKQNKTTIAINYSRGFDPSKRNDLFLLEIIEKGTLGDCYIIFTNNREYRKQKDKISNFEQEIKMLAGTNINLIPCYLPKWQLKLLKQSVIETLQLCKSLKLNLIKHPLTSLSMLIFSQNKNAYLNFFKKRKIELISNTHFNYEATTISAAAFSANIKSIFKEISVWGDWSSVYINKVICSIWISLTQQSQKYAKKNHLFVKDFQVFQPLISSIKKPALSSKKSDYLKILIIGSNIEPNNRLLIPQCMSIDHYKQIYSIFNWAKQAPNITITIKEKKNYSVLYQNILNDFKDSESPLPDTVQFIDQPNKQKLTDFAYDHDLYIALGTFYPSAIYELTHNVSKERLIFFDTTKLSVAFPEILSNKTMSVCRSEEELFQACESFYKLKNYA